MKEETAKTKWCPHNLGQDGADETGSCIASDCMMWVWDNKNSTTGEQWRAETGHCGLIK